jgi:predicted acylesterase/phospholipase RssA
MPGRALRALCFLLLGVGLIGWSASVGCRFTAKGPTRPVPLPPGTVPGDLIDKDSPAESIDPLEAESLAIAAKKIVESRTPKKLPEKKFNFLVLSGGGSYGAYAAGVIVGMTDTGTRPEFDVVTGVSTGALIAAAAFLGPEMDGELRRRYTTITNDDLFQRRRSLRGLFAESIVDNSGFRQLLQEFVTPQYLRRVAEEHAKGRRLYVGSTNLDTRRFIVWDMGAIATRGDADLFVNVIMASSAIPAFFPSVRFPIEVDGQIYEELHVDGGVSRAMFFRPPAVDPALREDFGPESLFDSNLYILVSGKLYEDPDGVRPRTLQVALASTASLLYSQARGDLFRLFTYAMLTGMNYHVAAIPPDLEISKQSTEFDPVAMTQLFCAGYNAVKEKRAFRQTPPGFEPGEETRARTGLRLSIQPEQRRTETNPTPESPRPPTTPGTKGVFPPSPPVKGGKSTPNLPTTGPQAGPVPAPLPRLKSYLGGPGLLPSAGG